MLLLAGALSAQVETKPYTGPEPEFIGEAIVVNWNGAYYPAEKTVAELKVKPQIIGTTLKLYVKGSKSPVRVEQGPVRIVVRAADQSSDPQREVTLIKYGGRRTRDAVVEKFNDLTSVYSFNDVKRVPFKGERYGKDSYMLTVDYLAPGEYGLFTGQIDPDKTNLIMSFGVDK